jgi:hypothetical protein
MFASSVVNGNNARRLHDLADSQVKVNINIRFLPFAHAVIQAKGSEPVSVEKKEQNPVYAEPKTTDTRVVEITFGGDN